MKGFMPGKSLLNTREDLFNANNLLGDKTQEILLPYIKHTEQIILRMIKEYDALGNIEIFPSLDLGIPNNMIRYMGGYATGMMFYWECKREMAFIDTTMNVCSSGYFELKDIGCIKDFFNLNKIKSILEEANRVGYYFDFTAGNHFLMLCKSNNEDKYYLITHFSDMKAKDVLEGLYPNEYVWYAKNIHTYFDESGRYIRYLVDEYAEKFYKKAKELQNRSELIHNWFAEKFCGDKIVQSRIHHHYGMPEKNVVIIGTYLAKKDDILPIFTNDSCPIYLFKPSQEMWHVGIGDECFYLIPHGWGQKLVNPYSNEFLQLIGNGEKAILVDKDNPLSYKTHDDYHFPDGLLEVRKFECMPESFFAKSVHYLEGEIIDTLWQKAIYSKKNKKVRYYE